MPSEDTKISEFNQYLKCGKASFIIYADLECIMEKIDENKNNPENSSTARVIRFFSMSKTSSCRCIENKHDVCIGKYCMKKVF